MLSEPFDTVENKTFIAALGKAGITTRAIIANFKNMGRLIKINNYRKTLIYSFTVIRFEEMLLQGKLNINT